MQKESYMVGVANKNNQIKSMNTWYSGNYASVPEQQLGVELEKRAYFLVTARRQTH